MTPYLLRLTRLVAFICAWSLSVFASDCSYRDPCEIWGFHVHMDVEPEVHAHALSLREALLNFMAEKKIPVTRTGAYEPGFGPHCRHSWEIRVEPQDEPERVLEYLGTIADWIMYHEHLPCMWIHPITHDDRKEDLGTELEDHLQRLVFGEEPVLDLDFFRQPPRDAEGRVLDTRTPHLLEESEVSKLTAGLPTFPEPLFQASGYVFLVSAFRDQNDTASSLWDKLERFLQDSGLTGTNGAEDEMLMRPNFGEVLPAYWLLLDGDAKEESLGKALGFFMLNRGSLPLSITPLSEMRDQAALDSAPEAEYLTSADWNRKERSGRIESPRPLDLVLPAPDYQEIQAPRSWDLHYAFGAEEIPEARQLFQTLVSLLDMQEGVAIHQAFFREQAAGPWNGPFFGIELVGEHESIYPQTRLARLYPILNRCAQMAREYAIQQGLKGTFIIHPNSAEEEEPVDERRDHYERAWKVFGPEYSFKDVWGGTLPLVERRRAMIP